MGSSTMTMEKIARLSGTARSTVHAVLQNKDWVSEKTRKKVLEVVERYNYQPNRLASALGSKSTRLVAVILKDIMNPFNSLLLEGINSVLSVSGYHPLLLSTEDDHDQEARAISLAESYRVDGIIITPQQTGVDLRHIWNLISEKRPLVSFGRIPGIETSGVELDETLAGDLAASYLIRKGHTSITLFSGPPTSAAAQGRADGFKNALMRSQIRFSPEMIREVGATAKASYGVAREILSKAESRPTGIVCYNDLVAAGVYRAAADSGVSIPEGLSVVGTDDIEFSSVFGPPLTTIRQPCFDMGKAMAEFLIQEIEGTTKTQFRTYKPELIERSSVRALGDVVNPTSLNR
jgi:DNA-binding LacI/PurR family transcriptional regulator